MDEDMTAAAWYQMELENWQQLESDDPGYAEWVESINHRESDTTDEKETFNGDYRI